MCKGRAESGIAAPSLTPSGTHVFWKPNCAGTSRRPGTPEACLCSPLHALGAPASGTARLQHNTRTRISISIGTVQLQQFAPEAVRRVFRGAGNPAPAVLQRAGLSAPEAGQLALVPGMVTVISSRLQEGLHRPLIDLRSIALPHAATTQRRRWQASSQAIAALNAALRPELRQKYVEKACRKR